MSMLTTNSDQKLTDIGSSGSNNNNFFNNLEMREHLFDKVLTPTDATRKADRIVIPKQHALDYFPPLSMNGQRKTVLNFTDRNGKTWKFDYWLWKTSAIYVLRDEWWSFLEEKQLVAGDTVSFHRAYIPDDNAPERRRQIMLIDWSYGIFSPFYRSQFQGRGVIGESHNAGSPLDDNIKRNLGRSEPLVCNSIPAAEPSQPSKKKKMRLFGVDVEESESSIGDEGQSSQSSTTKRMRLFGVDVEESSSFIGYTSSSSAVIRDDGQSSQRCPSVEIGASSSSSKQLSDDEDRERKGKSVQF